MLLQIKIDNEKCIKCGDCMSICPAGAIILENGKITVTEKCVLCLACVSDCRQDAVIIKK